MKEHYLDFKESIFIISFLATFKLACNTNRTQEGAAMWVLPHYLHETIANALKSRMCSEHRTNQIIASVCNRDTRSHKLLRSYLEVVNYLLRKCATGQKIAEYDAEILRYMQPANMNPKKYADDLVVKSCKVADVLREGNPKQCLLKRRHRIHPP